MDYVQRFKQMRDVLKSYVGVKLLDHFVTHTQEYIDLLGDTTKEAELKAEAFEKWCAYLLITRSDQSKYGSVVRHFRAQFSMENDQYPRTLRIATDILSSHKFDKNPAKGNNHSNKAEKSSEKKDDESVATNFVQKMKTGEFCYCCGSPKHRCSKCPKKDSITREEWYDRKAARQHFQDDNNNSENESDDNKNDDDDSVQSDQSDRSNRSTRSTGSRRGGSQWSGSRQHFQYQGSLITRKVFKQKGQLSNLKDVLILDSGSTLKATIANPDFCRDIRPAKSRVEMLTNAGKKSITLQADMTGFSKV
jgi:hypothetical protein